MDNLHRDAKIAIVTSRMGSIVDNTSGGGYGYRMSKAAVNIAGVSLARDLADRGIVVYNSDLQSDRFHRNQSD